MEHSENIGTLAKALAAASKEYAIVRKDSKNPFYKSSYADLSSVIDATYKALAAHDISVIQSPHGGDGLAGVTTLLIHSSGEWIKGQLLLPVVKADPQGVGSAITYARRYALQAFLNVAAEDDDGNAASGKSSGKAVESTNGKQPPLASPILDVKEKLDELMRCETLGSRATHELPHGEGLRGTYEKFYLAARAANDIPAMKAFAEVYEMRKKQLEGGAQ